MDEKTKGQLLSEKLVYKNQSAFDTKNADKDTVNAYCEDYKKFLDASKTEREAVASAIKMISKEGYVEYKLGDKLERGGKYYVEETKTSSGCRYLPMTDVVYDALKRILERRPKVKKEPMIDGYSGFIMLDKNGNPKVALHIENEMRWAMKKYKKLHPDYPLPHITPHVFRHTFCTNYANDGMDIKNLQYLMGHSDAGVTLNVYTHASYAHAAEQMAKISQFRQSPEMKKDGEVAAG